MQRKTPKRTCERYQNFSEAKKSQRKVSKLLCGTKTESTWVYEKLLCNT